MKWHIEESGWSNLWDVYDEDGNALVRDKTLENARLIAAAPDMLEALRDMIDELRHDELENRMYMGVDTANWVIKKAQKAIAKAESPSGEEGRE